MSEWMSYGLGDFLMFSPRTWYRLLELHNRAWWPLQAVALALVLGLIWAIRRRLRLALRLGLVLMGLSLLFVAWKFHWLRFADINLAAPYFAIAFAAEGLLLVGIGLSQTGLALTRNGSAARAGMALLGVAVSVHPVLLLASNRPMEQAEWFALAPDPTMLVTLAVLALLCCATGLRRPGLVWALLSVVPLLWCAISGATLWTLGASHWWLMPAAGLLVCGVARWQCTRGGPGQPGSASGLPAQ